MQVDYRNPWDYHANLVGNKYPAIILPAQFGCGDYWAYQDYYASEVAREQRAERMERFCPHDCSVPEGTELRSYPTPWVGERQERIAIAGQLVREGLRGSAVDDAVDRELYRRRVNADRQRLAGIVQLFEIIGSAS